MGSFEEDSTSLGGQNHPLYSIDRDHLDRLLANDSPSNVDIVDLARLHIRYQGFPGALDLQEDTRTLVKATNLLPQVI